MKINCQIMSKKENGKYYPDFDKLLDNALSRKEKEFILYLEDHKEFWEDGFVYNMFYIMQMSCGHYEFFQTSCNIYCPLDKALKDAEDHSKEECTMCAMGYSWPK